MDIIPIKNIFAAVFEKPSLDPILQVLSKGRVSFWGTEGTVKYLKSKGFSATSIFGEYDFDGRVKSLDWNVFARILADRGNKKHLLELKKILANTSDVKSGSGRASTSEVKDREPFDLVIVDLYAPDPKTFPQSMDIGGLSLIRAAVKNYKNVALAFDQMSVFDLAGEIRSNASATTLEFRKKQAVKAAKFIAQRCELEAKLLQ